MSLTKTLTWVYLAALILAAVTAIVHAEARADEGVTCVEQVSELCYHETLYFKDDCFSKATRVCSSGRSETGACVEDSYFYCYKNTSFSADDCFDKSLRACH